jgi:hypothetical protein
MVFDEALFSITFDRIASRLFSISDAIYSYEGGLQKPRRRLDSGPRNSFIASKNLPLKNIDRENLFPQAYRVDCFNQFNRGCVFSDSTGCSLGEQILRRASSNAVSWAFSPDRRSRIDYSWSVIPRAKKMVLIHGSHSPFREVS